MFFLLLTVAVSLCRGLLQVSSGLLQVEVALLVGSSGTKASAEVRGPSSSLKQKDGKDDAESETEGGLDEEVGKAAIPLLCFFNIRLVK